MHPFQSPWQTAKSGANLAFMAALLYGVIFSIFAVLRSSLQIVTVLSIETGMIMTLIANATSIFIVSIQFAIILGILAALIQASSWLLIFWILSRSGLEAEPQRLRVIAAGVSSLIIVFFHLLLWSSGGVLHAMIWRSLAGYLFWLGLPSLIFIGFTTWAWAQTSAAGMKKKSYAASVTP